MIRVSASVASYGIKLHMICSVNTTTDQIKLIQVTNSKSYL